MVDMQISCMIRVDISCKHLRIYIPPIQIEESVSANMHQSSIDNGGISDNIAIEHGSQSFISDSFSSVIYPLNMVIFQFAM